MILVTGATGRIGGEVVKQLAAAGVPVRAMVRQPDASEVLDHPNVEFVAGDLTKPETLGPALRGAEKVFLLSPQGGDPHAMEGPLVEAARAAGIQHVVKLAVMGSSPFSSIGFVRSHWEAEKLIEESGIPFTFVQANHLMQHFVTAFAPTISTTSTFYAPVRNGAVSMIDARDVAAVAVAALTRPGHEGKVYDITGPEALSYAAAADRLSQVLGRRVQYVDVPPEASLQLIMQQGGASNEVASDVVNLYQCFANGYASRITNGVERIARKQPLTFDQFARDYASAFQPRQVAPSH